jgi:Putative metallopeptidase
VQTRSSNIVTIRYFSRCKLLVLVFMLALLSAHAAPIRVAYGASQHNPGMVNRLAKAKTLESIAAHLMRFATSHELKLTLRDCGQANAMYIPYRLEIVLCTELIHQIQTLHASQSNASRRASLNGGTLLWIAAHEFGHALMHMRKWPVLGREEDAADQIATLVVMNSRLSSPALLGAMNYFSRDANLRNIGDVHSLDPQRRINIACWAYGGDPAAYQDLRNGIPSARQQTCRHEYLQIRRAVSALL